MPSIENILIICRSLKEIRLLSQVKIDREKKYIIASDDIRVHKAVEKYQWAGTVCFIEQMESFYNVADDVIRFLNIINIWLESLGDAQRGIPGELLFWIRHAEGGMTTQRIQDLLLLVRSYLHLIDNYKIGRIIILGHNHTYWEDSILTQTARARGIDIQIVGNFCIDAFKRKMTEYFKTIAIEIYYILNIFRVKIRNVLTLKRCDNFEKEIIVQPCGPRPKHLQYVIPLMEAINKKGYDTVALCWQMSRGVNRIRNENLYVEELESWLPISAIWKGSFGTFLVWAKAILKRKEFMLNQALQYQSVSIAKLLWPSFFFFFIGELPPRYRLMVAAKKYFEVHSPLAVRFCTTILPGSLIPFRCLQKNNRPIIFHQPWPTDSPYHHHLIPIDLVFALDDKHKEALEREGFPANNIVIIGKLNRNEVINFKKKCSQKQSLAYLKIPLTYSMYLFYDPGYILRGHSAPSEQASVTECLLDFVKTNPSIALIIKPHPSHHSGILESQIESYSLENVFLINSKTLPNHCLNAADLLITKYSTIGIEAMYLERPVISVILDGEARFKVFGNSAEYISTIEELRKLLSLLINDENYRVQWTSNLKQRAVNYLNLYDYKLSNSPYELIAEAVDIFIKEKRV